MAAKSAEGTQTETEETPGDCSGKKKSKFQAFKKLFVKKKRKESPAPSRESNLKPSQSSSDVSLSGANESAFQPVHESVSKSNLGSKAVSHDSVFISEMENSTKEDTSQENTPGKVKALQLQLQQNIRIGSPPQGIIHKKLEDSGALSEDDGLPRSPPEITSLHEILALSSGKASGISQRRSSLSLGGTDSEDEPESRETSSCPISPLNSNILLSSKSLGTHCLVDFTAPPSSVVWLDNSAAKHKIAIKPKKRRGQAMNANRIKDGAGIAKDFRIKEKTESKVVCDHAVSISHSSESNAEQEASKEQDTFIEDMIMETETDTTMPLIVQRVDSSEENTQMYEASFTENQIIALPAEPAESDVDFNVSCLIGEDKVTCNEEDPRTEKEGKVLHISHSAPVHGSNEITAENELSDVEDNAVEVVVLDVSEDAECDIFEDTPEIQENTMLETAKLIFNNKDQKYEYEVLPSLAELQKELPEGTRSTSTNVISIPQKHISETELDTSSKKADGHVGIVASECVVICKNLDNEKFFTTETLQELSTNVLTDQPRIDAPSVDEKVEAFDLRIIEIPTVTSSDHDSSKCATSSINLASAENSSDDIQCTKEDSSELTKTIKADSSVDSKLKTSNKPVRFTVAPAWQRSLSVGSSVKDAACSKDKVSSTRKSESYDGSEDPTMEINQGDCRKVEKNKEMVKANEGDQCVAFGVRLRRTSSSRKYSEEYPEEQSKLHPLSVETGSKVQIPLQTPVQTPPLHSDFPKVSKPSQTGEDKPRKKQKAEDLPSQETSEPAWITVAKLKQKGFQEHPLAREHSATAASDKDEGSGESSHKNNVDARPQEKEVKEMATISTDNQVEESLLESGKNSQPAQPQNPDEPPWFSLAKKKAKAWSKMPQIVQ